MDTSTRWALMKSSPEIAPNCPRCASSNTKFCYYNNYSLSQPRYFCKGCRRYWTKGGSLRNVPVGGGCRKSRRGRSSTRPLTSFMSKSDDGNGLLMSQDANTVNGNDIDMAAVFAKFLDPNLETESRDYHDHQKTDDLFFELTSSLESNNNSYETFEASYDASFGLEDLLSDQVMLPSPEAMWPSYDESLDTDVFFQSMVSQEECPCPSVTFPDSDDYNQMKGLGNVGLVDDHHGWSVGSCFDVTSYI